MTNMFLSPRRTLLRVAVLGGGLLGAMAAQGKTLALWPIEAGLRCVVDTRLGLTQGTGTTLASPTLPWEIPPCPDAAAHVVEPVNTVALWSTNSVGNEMLSVDNADLVKALLPTRAFTIEGWINIQQQPAENGWFIIAQANGGSSQSGGWIWSMRRQDRSQRHADFELFVKDDLSDTCIGNKWFADAADFTNKWLHVALTHLPKNASNLGEWNMYTNGVLYGTVTCTPRSTATSPGDSTLQLGGRTAATTQRFLGGLDNWRVSYGVLDPSEFLCAGGTGSNRPKDPSPTAFYWKLDRAADGTIDGSPQVGHLPISGGIPEKGTSSTGRFHPSMQQAFSGNPPNATVKIPGGNCGCFHAPQPVNQWRIDGLGAQLEVTNDFTVEGWFKPERTYRDGIDQRRVEYLFNTRMQIGGWALGLQVVNEQTWRLIHYAAQINAPVLVNSAQVSPDLSGWTDWKHVALTYDHAAAEGRGVWTFFLDGVQVGCATNSVVPTGLTDSQHFHIAGRFGTPTTFLGYVDCVRVTKGALNSRQFLCAATDGQPVPETDVLAFWPLDVKRGAYLCGDDLTGKYSFQPSAHWTDARMARATDDAPVITNPDRTETFAGSPTNLAGSVAFNTPANGNASSSALCTYSQVGGIFRTKSWTTECYVKRTSGTPTTWELLFGLMDDMTFTTGGMRINFTYRNKGFVLFDNLNCSIGDTAFPATSGNDLPEGRWAHVALTFKVEAGDGIYELFVDGVSKGTIRSAYRGLTGENVFVLGGRYHTTNSFKGNISSLRLSTRALAADEFLCATSAPVESEKKTCAYWPLEYNGSVLDLTSRVTTGAYFTEIVGHKGSTDQACAHVPRPDTSPSFAGDPRANAGSVTLSGEDTCRLQLPCLGLRMDFASSFTVEGWFKWAQAARPQPREVICGTFRPGNGKGWNIYIDSTGERPCVRLKALLSFPYTALVNDQVLLADATSWAGVWKHLALTYDVHAGSRGVWTLWVDGKVAGRVENAWSPQGAVCETEFFALGAIPSGINYPFSSAAGGYDLWRVSTGALGKSEFLMVTYPGFSIFLR